VGDLGDLPLSSEWTWTSGIVIVNRSNGEGKGLWIGRGDVIPSKEDAFQDKGNNAVLEFTEKELKAILKSSEVVQG